MIERRSRDEHRKQREEGARERVEPLTGRQAELLSTQLG